MKEYLEEIAKEKGLQLASIRFNGKQLFFVKTKSGHLLNDGCSMDSTETLEFIEDLPPKEPIHAN